MQNISILGNGNSVTGANTDEANAGTTANVTIIGGSNEVTGRDGAGSDYMGKTWNQLTRTTVIGYKTRWTRQRQLRLWQIPRSWAMM